MGRSVVLAMASARSANIRARRSSRALTRSVASESPSLLPLTPHPSFASPDDCNVPLLSHHPRHLAALFVVKRIEGAPTSPYLVIFPLFRPCCLPYIHLPPVTHLVRT